jgi:hypothetical protein
MKHLNKIIIIAIIFSMIFWDLGFINKESSIPKTYATEFEVSENENILSEIEKIRKEFYEPLSSPEEVIMAYHLNQNAAFNKRIRVILEKKEKAITNAPLFDSYCKEKGNAATYCLALDTLPHLQALKKELFLRKDDLPIADDDDNTYTIEEISNRYTNRLEEINKTLSEVDDVLNIGIETYANFKLYYLLHQKNLEMIEVLIDLRESLGEARRSLERYKSKFINATSKSCT